MGEYRTFKGKSYKRIACWRRKFMADRYAVRLREGRTTYSDIIVAESSKNWWCVYGRENIFGGK